MKKIVLTLILGSALANCNAVGGSGSGAMMLLPFLSSSSDTSTPAVASSAATEGTTFTVVSLDSITPTAIPVETITTGSSTGSSGSTSGTTTNSSSTASSTGTVAPEQVNVTEQQTIAVQAAADAEAAAKAAKAAQARKDQEAATQAAIDAQIAAQAAAEAAAAIQAQIEFEAANQVATIAAEAKTKAEKQAAADKAKAEADKIAAAEAEAKARAEAQEADTQREKIEAEKALQAALAAKAKAEADAKAAAVAEAKAKAEAQAAAKAKADAEAAAVAKAKAEADAQAAAAKAKAEADAIAAAEAEAKARAEAEAAATQQAKIEAEKALQAALAAKAKAEAEAQAVAAAEAKAKADAENQAAAAAKAKADAEAAAAAKAKSDAEAAAIAQAAADKAAQAAKEAAAAAAAKTTVQTVTEVKPLPVAQQFTYESNVTVPVVITIADKKGPVPGVPCTVSETTTSSTPTVLGTGNTNAQGVANIPISVPPNVTNVNISAVGNNPTTGEPIVLQGQAPVLVPAAPASTGTSTTTPVAGSTPSTSASVAVSPSVTLNTTNFQASTSCNKAIDTDCDGVLNAFDDFPNDASLSQRIRSGRYTIAFEDLWPNAGDADLNDFVALFSTEMDRTPDGLVKNLRGVVTIIGKGAGYNHELRLSLNVPSTAQFNQTFVNDSNQPWTVLVNKVAQAGCNNAQSTSKVYAPNTSDCKTNVTLSTTELRNGILIMPSSDLTLFGSQNVATNLTKAQFRKGVTSNFSFSFTNPVDLNTAANMVGGHLNWNLVINQGPAIPNRNRVYRPGFVTENKTCTIAGRTVTQIGDKFMDCGGFPWAIIVPGVFNFPNGSNDIRSANTGYPAFQTWAASKGQSNRDWYAKVVNPQFVVNVRDFYQDASFTAYMIKAVKSNILAVSLGLIVIGASMGFLLKKKVKPSIA